jgi:hypothetical protein
MRQQPSQCCLLLDTIPDWELSLRVAFTVFALCMVTAAVFVQQGDRREAGHAGTRCLTFWETRLRRRSLAAAHNQIVSDGAEGYIAGGIEHGL